MGVKWARRQRQEEPYKSPEPLHLIYDALRDCFGKEAATSCKDTVIYTHTHTRRHTLVCVCLLL